MRSSQVTIGILCALAVYYAIEDETWKAIQAILLSLVFAVGAAWMAGVIR